MVVCEARYAHCSTTTNTTPNYTQYVNIIVTPSFFSGTPPTIVQPPNGGYWVDGVEENSSDEESESRPQPGTPRQNSRRHNIDTDDTAKYYRRFFLGKVRYNI